MTPKSNVVAVDFFCGAGGMTRGLLDAGIDVLCGIDNDVSAKDTYEKNNNVRFIRRDIRWLKTNELAKYISRTGQRKLLFAACAPCQPFSKINRHRKKSLRQRSLLLELTRFIRRYRPDFILCENVPGIVKPRYGKIFQKFCRRLERHGYRLKFEIIDAKCFGIPQSRKRMFLLAADRHGIGFPRPDPKKYKTVTVKNAIGHLPRIKAGQTHDEVPNHRAANLSDLNLKRIALTSRNGGGRKRWPSFLYLPCHKTHSGHSDVYGRMKWNAPSPPITTRCISYSNGRFGHPSQNRAITPREAAALQTFPDDYVFHSVSTIAARHIGNAVPVLLARIFGKFIVKADGTMADIYDTGKRSWIMSRVRGKWTGLDKTLHNQLKGRKVRHRMYPALQGRPDVLVGNKLVIFINGCFWHACPKCKPQMPQGNRDFWRKKIADNKRRDKRVDRELIALGYSVMRLWGHEIKTNLSHVVNEIESKATSTRSRF